MVWCGGIRLADVAAKAERPSGASFHLSRVSFTGFAWGRQCGEPMGMGCAADLRAVILLFMMISGLFDSAVRAEKIRRGRACGLGCGGGSYVGGAQLAHHQFSVDWWNTLHKPRAV